tara:strand:- start:306 stop:560 length:255 start_codon:yes stop_codon:yes gene_type:complete
MSREEKLEKEYSIAEKDDKISRLKSIKDGEELDKNIQKRMKAGEIGVSNGIDNHIGMIMFITATIFTIFALYFVFGVIPDRLES